MMVVETESLNASVAEIEINHVSRPFMRLSDGIIVRRRQSSSVNLLTSMALKAV